MSTWSGRECRHAKSLSTNANPVVRVSTRAEVRTERFLNPTLHEMTKCFQSDEPSSTRKADKAKPEITNEDKELDGPLLGLAIRSETCHFPPVVPAGGGNMSPNKPSGADAGVELRKPPRPPGRRPLPGQLEDISPMPPQ